MKEKHSHRFQAFFTTGYMRFVALLLLLFSIPMSALLVQVHTNIEQHASSQDPCVIPSTPTGNSLPHFLGLDSYLHWDKLSYLDIGDRVVGESTADSGANNHDNVHILRTLQDGEKVLFDQTGPGVATFLRMQESIGNPWNVSIDGNKITSFTPGDMGLTTPASPPGMYFPYPLSLNPSESQGTSIVATQIPFQKELLFTSASQNGNFYSLYRKLPFGAQLPQWNDTAKTNAVSKLLQCAGNSIVDPNLPQKNGTLSLSGTQPVDLVSLDGPSQIRLLSFHVPFGEKVRFANSRIQIYWDNEQTPSVDVPIKFFIGDGAGVYQPSNRPLVRGFLASANGDGSTYMDFNAYWPMPFSSHAHIVIVPGPNATLSGITWKLLYEPFSDPPSWWGKFHVTYTDIPNPPQGQDMHFLDIKGSGRLVGTVINFSSVGGTLEGNPHMYIDDSNTPQIAVTGTEEWGMGGNYWNNNNQTSLPMAGLPSSTNNPSGSDIDGAAEYRFLIADSIPFNTHLIVNWEHGAVNDTTNPYRAAMFWYGTPTATAVLTDQLNPSDTNSKNAHSYQSPNDQISQKNAAYEYLVNSPLQQKAVIATNTTQSFQMVVDPQNSGGFLRRTFDYCVPDQRADIFIDNQPAGTWYNAGQTIANQGPDGHLRCWKDEDFPLPASLLQNKSKITIRIAFAHTSNPANTSWTATGYQLYSFMLSSPSSPSTLTPTFTPTPTFAQNSTVLTLAVCPHGLGNCGDNVTPGNGGNTNPLHPSRFITATFLNASGAVVSAISGNVVYRSASQTFQNNISLNNTVPSGDYLVRLSMDGFLPKQVTGIITITQGQTAVLPLTPLVTGNINNDSQLDLTDYNMLISCFGAKFGTSQCLSPEADLNDDGVVDGTDYNYFLREISVQR